MSKRERDSGRDWESEQEVFDLEVLTGKEDGHRGVILREADFS